MFSHQNLFELNFINSFFSASVVWAIGYWVSICAIIKTVYQRLEWKRNFPFGWCLPIERSIKEAIRQMDEWMPEWTSGTPTAARHSCSEAARISLNVKRVTRQDSRGAVARETKMIPMNDFEDDIFHFQRYSGWLAPMKCLIGPGGPRKIDFSDLLCNLMIEGVRYWLEVSLYDRPFEESVA
jgi:hypothetical protein